MPEEIKEAFSRVKKDIFSLGEEIQQIRQQIFDLQTENKLISSFINDLKLKEMTPTHPEEKPTIPTHFPTIQHIMPKTPTDDLPLYALKSQYTDISIGNGGVPTNKPTNQQTNQQIIQHIPEEEKPIKIQEQQEINHLEKAEEILASLDALKKEIRLKFKRLTSQEIAVFSFLYSLESQGYEVDYPLLSSKLKLSEASIRDYIGKIQKKGIPIIKEKLNNKKVLLHISQELKKIASLDTILKLREL